ncbi:MAG: 2-C-methyl-D-erythritol 4-phosphate cytidylyltransferase [Candidatus Omnitrophota bacterium]
MKVSAIVASAGCGKRFKSRINKAFVCLQNKPIAAFSLKVIAELKSVSEIIFVINKDDYRRAKKLLAEYRVSKPVRIVFGGSQRHLSVYRGLKSVSEEADLILVHDAARPLIDKKIVEQAIAQAKRYGAAAIAVPVISTIKQADNRRFVTRTLPRQALWDIQTPQVFCRKLLLRAYECAEKKNVTDDAMLVERIGEKVKIVKGRYSNIKITTQIDLRIAEELIKSENSIKLAHGTGI